MGSGGIVPPKQRRTQANVERILAAADDLIELRPFADVAVLEICDRAEVSTSSFYARFASKEVLLAALFERHVTDARSELAGVLAALDDEATEPRRVVKAVLGQYVAFVRRNDSLMRSIELDPALAERHWGLTAEVAEVLRGRLEAMYGLDDSAFRHRVEIGMRLAGAAVLRAVGVPRSFGERIGMTDEELVEELGEMLVAYLDRAAALDGNRGGVDGPR